MEPVDKRHRAVLRVIAHLDVGQPGGYFPLSQILERFRVGEFGPKQLRTEAQNHSEALRSLRHLYKRGLVKASAGSYGLTAAGHRIAAFLTLV